MSEQHCIDEENKENDEHLKERCQESTLNMELFFKMNWRLLLTIL
jgi:hypothetical protein